MSATTHPFAPEEIMAHLDGELSPAAVPIRFRSHRVLRPLPGACNLSSEHISISLELDRRPRAPQRQVCRSTFRRTRCILGPVLLERPDPSSLSAPPLEIAHCFRLPAFLSFW